VGVVILPNDEPLPDDFEQADFTAGAPAYVPATKPGARLSFDAYKAIDAVNFTSLKQLFVDRAGPHEDRLCITSPYRYQYFKLQGDTRETDAMRVGRATHTAVFEPDSFMREYALFDGKVRAGKAWDAFRAMHAGRTILTSAQYDKAIAIRDAVRTNSDAMFYLQRGEAEKAITWTDKPTGLRCKARLDFLSHVRPCVVDLKTTNDIGERAFKAQCEKMGYFRQLAMYTAGAVAADLLVVPRAVIIAVENKPPYEVAVYPIEADALVTAGEEVAELLGVLKDCLASDSWPPRYTTEQVLARPSWVSSEPEIAFEEQS
jgi:hypothetical protein